MARRSWWSAARRSACLAASSTRFIHQSVQLDGREVIRDRALGLWGDEGYGPGLTVGVMVSGPPPMLLHVRHLHVPLENRVLRNGLHGPGPPRGSVASTCGSQTPMGLCTWAGLGGPDLPSLGEEVRCCHVPLRMRQLGQLCHVIGGRRPSAGR
jgi:hypothetical protein